MAPNKRKAAAVPSGQQRTEKKQKTAISAQLNTPKTAKPTAKATALSMVVPVTPGAAVDPSARRKQQQSPTKEPRPEKRPKTAQTDKAAVSKKQSPNKSAQKQSEPVSLPLEPHAAILEDLESKYDVHTLSVISSSKMEKRIKSILGHLESKPVNAEAQSEKTPSTSRPGIALLHCRVADANKMISIAEIVKQRIREGHFSKETAGADGATKKKGKKGSKLSNTAWYQYNRIYDVSVPKETGATSGASEDGGDEDEGFAPMVHRLDEALKGKSDSQRQITTYMSIILSRTPVVELQKKPEISVQASTDPLEVEFEQWVART